MQRMQCKELACLIGILVAMCVPAVAEKRPNILLICVDDLRPELKSFGVDYIHSPHIDALAAQGRAFHQHYVNAPSCGPSRYTLLTGRFGSGRNTAIFSRAKKLREAPGSLPPSLPEWLRYFGYTSVSVGKVSHHPGGRGGQNWDEDEKPEIPGGWDRHIMPVGAWQHPRGAMHGLAHGEIRDEAKEQGKKMAVMQSVDGPADIYPDGLITNAALEELESLSKGEKPFFLAVGFIRPHLPFGAPAEYMKHYRDVTLPETPYPEKPSGQTTWRRSGEFMAYDTGGKDPWTDTEYALELRKHYAASITYADAQVGRVLSKLEETGQRENTVIILWGDHGWHLGEHAVWGKHTLFEESLRSPLVIVSPQVNQIGKPTHSIVETIDLFPTICDLVSVTVPDFLQGKSLLPQLEDTETKGTEAIGYYGRAQTLRTATHRMTLHRDGHVELYDHRTPEAET